jgi:hypothetical protein
MRYLILVPIIFMVSCTPLFYIGSYDDITIIACDNEIKICKELGDDNVRKE